MHLHVREFLVSNTMKSEVSCIINILALPWYRQKADILARSWGFSTIPKCHTAERGTAERFGNDAVARSLRHFPDALKEASTRPNAPF